MCLRYFHTERRLTSNSAKDANGLPVTLEAVNKALDQLNDYSDKTIYSFNDMTANIGKFTNAGVSLEDSVTAIKGISNVAASAGASAQNAASAMYNFGQALGTGVVKLIDWRSINNANMSTIEFKEQLIQTAKELGTLKEVGDKYIATTYSGKKANEEAFNA
ncbi:MAG: tape measure protein, partial [Schwartzia succinivorans]|nr:tape measure protein [Schwartzia succinivorans]